jgi:hypothetical protein
MLTVFLYVLGYFAIGYASCRLAAAFDVWCDFPDREPETMFFWAWPLAWAYMLWTLITPWCRR